MKLVVGLGNPGNKYEHTRHNAGFLALDLLRETENLPKFQEEKKFFALLSETGTGNDKIIFLKPNTFMNDSGKSVGAIKNFYNIRNSDILIVHDEVDLPFGKIRFSENASSAGHKGVESIIIAIGQDFSRLRIGVETRSDRRDQILTEDYVLQKFSNEELEILRQESLPQVTEEIKKWLQK